MSKSSEMAQRRALARSVDDPDYRRRRDDLLQAAAAVFKRKGFAAASLNDVAMEVGIDRASIYYYVSGKEELYQEIVHQAVLQNVLDAEELVARSAKAVEKLRQFVRNLMLSYEKHYPYLFIFVQENMGVLNDQSKWTKELRALGRRFDKAVIGMIQQGLDDGEFKTASGDARLIAFALIGMCNWSHRWFKPGGRDSAAQIGDAFADLFLNGLLKS